MQSPDNAEDGPEGDDGDNGVAGGPAHPTFTGDEEGAEAKGADSLEHSQGQGAVQGPVQDGDSSAEAGVVEQELQEFRLTVRFHSTVDAEIGYWLLAPLAGSLQEGVHISIILFGNYLNIRLTSENSHFLEIATAACDFLYQVFTVLLVFEELEA
ncbi:hypothetical protein H920_19486 [Fukomys damarensis]|uniref:Uncharacterized protein n=1 Tax=Fukomys damarensis TaxID=885580 RepID=A0A091CMG9_FUKDA|nr:hypothetical protein H920_19486 [Fukomys damarensis]